MNTKPSNLFVCLVFLLFCFPFFFFCGRGGGGGGGGEEEEGLVLFLILRYNQA